MDKFTFDEREHAYTLNDRRLPSVTEIVSDVYGNGYLASEFHLNKGSMVHRAIELYLKGILNEKTVDERIKGKVEAGKKAIKELNLKPAVIEKPMYHIYMYAGKPDVLTVDSILVDWKSAHSPLTTPAQGGGYSLLFTQEKFSVKRFFEIVLKDDGNYSLAEYNVKKCERLFLAALTVWGHKKEG
jgi:hypothetical protein